jgi:hypothetical protein
MMKNVRRFSIAFVVAAVLGTIAVLVSIAVERSGRRAGDSPVASVVTPADASRVDGLNYTAYDGETPRFRVRADLITVAKRKYGFVYLSPLQEAVVTNLDLDLYESSGDEPVAAPGSAPPFDEIFAEAFPAHMMRNVGVMTRVRIDGVRVTRYRNGRVVSTVIAEHAEVDPRSKTTNLTGNVKVAVNGGRWVLSSSGTWDQRTGWIAVDGPYLEARDGKVTQGHGARFDMELHGIRS